MKVFNLEAGRAQGVGGWRDRGHVATQHLDLVHVDELVNGHLGPTTDRLVRHGGAARVTRNVQENGAAAGVHIGTTGGLAIGIGKLLLEVLAVVSVSGQFRASRYDAPDK